MTSWKMVSWIAGGIAAVSIIAIIVFYSIPFNPCTLIQFQDADADLAPTTTKELYDNAEVVVLGRITDSSAECEGTQIWTHMQVQVEEYLKNQQESRTLTAKSIGGAIGNYGIGVEDSPIYNKGDRVLLYLYKENPGDRTYRISFPTGIIQDQDVSGNELLKSMSLGPATNDPIPLARGTSTTVVLSLESFFGYTSPTNVTATSFTFYNSSTHDSFNDSIIALSDFGLILRPAYMSITLPANGTETIEFKINATNEAIEGVYDIYFLAIGEDRFYYVNPSAEYAFVRVNVTDDSRTGDDIPAKILMAEGITLGAPYLVQVSWNLFETLHGNGTDLSVLIKDKDTMEPLKDVTYDFMYKGNFELGGFQDKYIADFSTPDRFRTGIQNPCDMHLTIFIEKVGDQSFANNDFDTSSVMIQFRTFPENESVDCYSNNIKLSLFNGYDLRGNRVPS